MFEHRDVVVVGAGQAGLAIGHHLALEGRDFTILEAASEVGAAWRSRWDSLRLFTPARYDGLPGRSFPGDPAHYPTRDEVVEYLASYARDFELPVEPDSAVRALRRSGDGYRLELDDRVIDAAQVVVATGPFQTRRTPMALARTLDPHVAQLHSSEYRRPERIPTGSVLVVGGGNSGFQIAEELARDPSRDVHLAVGSRMTPLPRRILGRELFSVLDGTGLMAKPATSRVGRRFKARETLVGSSPRRARRQGIRLHSRVVSTSGRRVCFADGTDAAVEAVIWATGFGLDYSWIDASVFDREGHVRHERGVTSSPGLYFIGLPWMHTRGSALLGWVQNDAAHLARRIAEAAGRDGALTTVPVGA